MGARGPLILLSALVAWCGGAHAAIKAVPPLNTPLAPTPVVRQLQADLAVIHAGAIPELAPSALPLTPSAWSNIRLVAAQPVLDARGAVAGPSGALRRIQLAQEVLGGYDPASFEALAPDERNAALARLWDGWRTRGLLTADVSQEAAGSPADRLVLEGVRDAELTSANKSIFLGVAILGYPLEDALWLTRTNIHTAHEENTLRYPQDQPWLNPAGTPEFLGVSRHAQPLLDDWAAAVEHGRGIIAQVRTGSTKLPKSAKITPQASAAFANLVRELLDKKDFEAVAYLRNNDPTLLAFLLDARKPGYYQYNGSGPIIKRLFETSTAGRMGLSRVDKPDAFLGTPETYLYRPQRVLTRLREIEREPATRDTREAKARLTSYIERLAPLIKPAPRISAAPYSFVEPQFLAGSALRSPSNFLLKLPPRPTAYPRYNPTLRVRLDAAERPPELDAQRWRALQKLIAKTGKSLKPGAEIRLATESWQTQGGLIAPAEDAAAAVMNLSVLDEILRLEKRAPDRLPDFLRFAAAAVEGALLPRE
ncbi:MAG: hypothetical protein HYZ74_03305 [Elusimicrobia bacterium]|nr:hypothetical protein [Elusimicrobiota bacterium]